MFNMFRQGYTNSHYDPTTSGSRWVSPHDDEYASKTYANIVRGEYGDYLNRFRPYEMRMMELSRSNELLDQQLSRITTTINHSFNNQNMSDTAIRMQRYGIHQSQQQKQSHARQSDMNKAMSIAHARNNTRMAASDRQFGLMTGSGGQRQTVRNDFLGGN